MNLKSIIFKNKKDVKKEEDIKKKENDKVEIKKDIPIKKTNNDVIDNKEKSIVQREKELDKREKKLDMREKAILEKESKIEELVHIIEENEVIIKYLRQKLKVADDALEELKLKIDIPLDNSDENYNDELLEDNNEDIKLVETLILGTNKVENEIINLDCIEDKDIILSNEIEEINNEEKNETEKQELRSNEEEIQKIEEPENIIDGNINEHTEIIKETNNQISEEKNCIENINEVTNMEKNNDIINVLYNAIIQKKYDDIESILDKVIESIDEIEEKLENNDLVLLVYLGFFYNRLEELLEKSPVVNNYFISWNKENILLKLLIEEKNYKEYIKVEECASEYFDREKDLFESLIDEIKEYIITKMNENIIKRFYEVYNINDIEYGDKNINVKAWVKSEDNVSWILVEGLYSLKNNELYLMDSVSFILKLKVNRK